VASNAVAGRLDGGRPADAHRRGRLEHPQHVGEAGRAAQIVDERGQPEPDRAGRAELGAARQVRPSGRVRAGAEQ
jgi:hypothetical protein